MSRVRLRFGGAGLKAGDVVEVDEARAAALVADGNAIAVAPDPEPKKKSDKD